MKNVAEIYMDALLHSEVEGSKSSIPTAKEWAKRNGMVSTECERLHLNLMYLLYGKTEK